MCPIILHVLPFWEAIQKLLVSADGVLILANNDGAIQMHRGYNSLNFGYFIMHVLDLLGVSCGGQSLLTWLGPHTFAYLNNATQVVLAWYDVRSHTDFAAFMAEIGPLPKSEMKKNSDICKSYGLPHLVSPGVCWTNVLISLCEVGTVFTHLQKEFLEAKPEQIWAHMHMVAQSFNRRSKGEVLDVAGKSVAVAMFMDAMHTSKMTKIRSVPKCRVSPRMAALALLRAGLVQKLSWQQTPDTVAALAVVWSVL